MRGRSSSKRSKTNTIMEVERPKLKEDPNFSGANIRSLVKELSSSKPPEPTCPNISGDSPVITGESIHLQQLGNPLGKKVQEQSSPPPPPQPKKQVRRRLHTTRPYQERLLNMAEARREIVTALKFHRAAMKKASEQHKQQQLHQPPAPPSSEDSRLGLLLESLKNPSNTIFQPNPMTSCFSSFSYPSSSCSWIPISDNHNLPLPHQPLGLNLNFQDFATIETPLFSSIKAPPSPAMSSSSSSSSAANSTPSDPALHPALGDEEMAEIRLISEMHDIEWNDTMSLVTTARWSKFLKAMEVDQGDGNGEGGEILEIPLWLSNGTGMDGHGSYLLDHPLDDDGDNLPW